VRALSGGGRRKTAVADDVRWWRSPASSISGSGTRFDAREASTWSARIGEANRGGVSGGDTAERTDGAAARLRNSGEVARGDGVHGTSSCGTRGLLTSLRGSWVASRRRSGGRGEESTAAAEGWG
jgi:hypothetical protein